MAEETPGEKRFDPTPKRKADAAKDGDVLRSKETGPPLTVAIGDMTTTQVDGPFSLVFLVFNTIDNLTTQDAQVACFRNAAAHLGPGGRFVIETLVPPIQRLAFGETRLPFPDQDGHTGYDAFDVATQSYASHHIWDEPGGRRELTVPFRYAWPAELDLMAKIKRIRTKKCQRCENSANTLYRVRLTKQGDWTFVCPVCLDQVRNGNPDYQYGGTWKARKRH